MAQVLVQTRSAGLDHEVKTSRHSFIADAGKDIGGSEMGPDPHELMLAALGACTSMTLKLFAGKRGWDLKEVTVELDEDRIDSPESPGKQISRITRQIRVAGDLTQEQIDTLKGIADKCPIHKLLTGEKKIETNLSADVQPAGMR